MRVLLLTQVLPYPPDSGPKVKTYHVLKYLAAQHEVTLVSFVRDSDQPEYIQHLETICQRVITVPIVRSKVDDLLFLARSFITGQPWMMLRDSRPQIEQILRALATETSFDVVHADQLNMAQYALIFPQARKVLDLHNALWMLYRRMAETSGRFSLIGSILRRDWRLLKRYEGEMCQRFDAVLAVSEEDRQLLIEAGAPENITVIPIAVDTQAEPMLERRVAGPHIVHIGTMYWPPNIDGIRWFLDEIYPLIKQQVPDVRCTLIGARPPESIVQYGESDPSIMVTGYVDDPQPLLQTASMMMVPLRAGGGMRVKIINALVQGMPMVSTTIGCEGIAVTPEQDILIADSPAVFAEQCCRLLTDAALNQKLAIEGRKTAIQYYDYRQACRPLDAIYMGQQD